MPAPTRSLTTVAVHDHVRRHCFTPGDQSGQVGVELELLTMAAGDTDRRPSASQLSGVVTGPPLPEHGRLTIEPGGQIELSSLPRPGPRAAIDATAADLVALRSRLEAAGLATTALGLDPARGAERVVHNPRYDAMEAYFEGDGGAGATMMCNTASVQVNLDLGDPAGLARRWRLAHALGPVLVAAFANSPLAGGSPTGARSSRQQIWSVLDPSRSAPATLPLSPADAWARYALDAQVMLLRVGPDTFAPARRPLSFARWMADGHEVGYPTLDDFVYHLTTLFPPVRPKGWLELRMIDSLPDPWWQVAVAVTTALMDDPEAFALAERACRPVAGRWADAAVHGLGHPDLASAARTCFSAAINGLPRLGVGPRHVDLVVEFADRYVDRGRCPADDVLDLWHAGARDLAGAGR